jgi:hypothetical protein
VCYVACVLEVKLPLSFPDRGTVCFAPETDRRSVSLRKSRGNVLYAINDSRRMTMEEAMIVCEDRSSTEDGMNENRTNDEKPHARTAE